MFSGTIRYNLDPFNERSDSQLWLVLAQVSMKTYVSSLTLGLESHVSEYGDNFRYATQHTQSISSGGVTRVMRCDGIRLDSCDFSPHLPYRLLSHYPPVPHCSVRVRSNCSVSLVLCCVNLVSSCWMRRRPLWIMRPMRSFNERSRKASPTVPYSPCQRQRHTQWALQCSSSHGVIDRGHVGTELLLLLPLLMTLSSPCTCALCICPFAAASVSDAQCASSQHDHGLDAGDGAR
jgi:hypothetical protein